MANGSINTINNPALFVTPGMRQVFADIQNGHYRWLDQPFWPQGKTTFTKNDRTNRRKLISALVARGSSSEQQSIGYQLLMCSRAAPCRSPLCNYCRTKLQDRYQKRVLRYFQNTAKNDLLFLTILDDLTYSPATDIPLRIRVMESALRRLCSNAFEKQVKVFGAFEIDVKDAGQIANNPAATALLQKYGYLANSGDAFMPHFHGIVALDGVSDKDFRDKLTLKFAKSKQVSLSGMRKDGTIDANLKSLARYMFKFRYQYADNILRGKPSYGSRFSDDTLRDYAEVVHSIKGSRGVRGLEFNYNLQ